MIRMNVLKKRDDCTERKETTTHPIDTYPLQDVGDGWRVNLKKKHDHQAEALEGIALTDDTKMKIYKKRETEVDYSQDMSTDKDDVETKSVSLTSPTESDFTTKDMILTLDDMDEDKSQRCRLITNRKPSSVIVDDIQKTSFANNRDEFRDLKVVLAVLIGLILSGALFLVLHYCFGYTSGVAGGISGAVTLVLCVATVFSVHARCVVVLTSVGVFSGKGRASLLCIITGILLTGPVLNIGSNVNEVVNSLACITEMANNQSLALHQSLEMPLKDVEKQLRGMADSVKEEAHILGTELDVIDNGVLTVTNGVDQAKSALQGASMACKKTLNSMLQQCQETLSGTRSKCREKLSKIDPSKAVKSLFDKLNPEGWFGRRKRASILPTEAVAGNHIRNKRGIEDVCNIFDTGDVCATVSGTDFCKPVSFADDIINEAMVDIVKQVTRIREHFHFELVDTGITGAPNNTSKSEAQTAKKVQELFRMKLHTVLSIVNVFSKALSMFFLLLVLQAYWYKRNYLASLSFDNIYITEQMRDIDADRIEKKQELVLPLRRHEKQTFIKSSSTRCLRSEGRSRSFGIALVFVHMLIVVIIVFIDYVFYYILHIIIQQAQDQHSGNVRLGFHVEGSGTVTEIFRTFVNGFNSQNFYRSITNVEGCFAMPNIPDRKTVFVLFGMYTLTFIIILIKPYGVRLRPKIAAFYFPQHEVARVKYLHRLIEVNRKRYWLDIKDLTTKDSNDGRSDDEINWKPCKRISELRSKKMRLRCLQCQRKVTKAWMCDIPSCQVVLCRRCFEEIGEQCPLCCITKPQEDLGR